MGMTTPAVDTLPNLKIGQVEDSVEGFEVKGVVGSGGMGIVELAYQHALQRDVAIKRPHDIEENSKQSKALLREGVINGQLEHPNLVPVYALGRTEDGRPALVMKKISGICWRDMIQDEHHPAWDKVQGDRIDWHVGVMLQLSNAMSFAHSRGFLHRDIKPENVMLGDFGEVYLLDWGVGQKLQKDGTYNIEHFAGTLGFAAPEMLGGELTVCTDIYLLGATLHEALTGELLHNGGHLTSVLLQIKQSNDHNYDSHIPTTLADICNKATHKEPSERFQSANEFREALEDHLRRRNAIALVETANERLETFIKGAKKDITTLPLEERFALNSVATECRFALQEALKIWPDMQAAHTSLQECTRWMAHIELELGNSSSAELLLAELDVVPEDFADRLQVLKDELEESAKAQEKLALLERNLDSSLGSERRGQLMILPAIIILGIATLHGWWTNGFVVRTSSSAFVRALVTVTICCLIVPFFRNVLLLTSISRRMLGFFFTACFSVLFNRLLGLYIDISVEATYTIDLLMICICFTLASIALEPLLIGAAICYALGLIAATIWPSYAYVMFLTSVTVSGLWVYFIWNQISENLGLTKPSSPSSRSTR